MGDNTSRDLASAVSEGYDLDAVLTMHLRTNHFPPLPAEFVSVAKAALEKAQEAEPHPWHDGGFFEPEVLDEEVEWPNVGIMPTGGRQDEDGKVWSTARRALEVMHLWAYVTIENDQDEED